MRKTQYAVTVFLSFAILALAPGPGWADQKKAVEGVVGTPTGTLSKAPKTGPTGPRFNAQIGGTKAVYLSPSECRSLGCVVIGESSTSSCPTVTHSGGTNKETCYCDSGSACITEADPR